MITGLLAVVRDPYQFEGFDQETYLQGDHHLTQSGSVANRPRIGGNSDAWKNKGPFYSAFGKYQIAQRIPTLQRDAKMPTLGIEAMRTTRIHLCLTSQDREHESLDRKTTSK
jgi:hypothetical protein